MRSNNKALNLAMRFFEVIILLFIMLKVMKIINWSWWWVLTPLWIFLGIVISLIVVYCIKYQEFKDELET